MAKSLSTIATTQTFQAWLDKTNEMVGVFNSDAVTASPGGDTTNGNATLVGNFTATNVTATGSGLFDDINVATPGQNITLDPIAITASASAQCAVFSFSSGGQTRYTDGSLSWDVGLENSNPGNFIIDTGTGTTKLELSPAGTLTVPNLVTTEAISIGTTLTVTGTATFNGGISGLDTSTVPEAAGATFSNNQQYFSRTRAHSAFSAGSNITFTDIANDVKTIAVNAQPSFTNVRIIDTPATGGFDPDGLGARILQGTLGGGSLAESTMRLQTGHGIGTSTYADRVVIYNSRTEVKNSLSVEGSNGISSDSRIIAGGSSNATYIRSYGDVECYDGANGMTIQLDGSTGNIIAEGDVTAYGTASDINLKENIEVIPNALDKVAQIRGVTFNYKDKPKEKMTGLIAQELEEVLPGVVYHVENDNKTKFKALRYGNVVGLLVEAIKELQTKVDELEKKCSCNNDQNS
jgi:hypothetical protein